MRGRDIIAKGGSTAEGVAKLATEAEIKHAAQWRPGSVSPVAEVVTSRGRETLPAGYIQEYRFHPKRLWRFDFAWPEWKIYLEIEGGVYTKGRHLRPKGFLSDMEKYNAATILGWRMLRATPKDLRTGKAAALVRRAMSQLGKANR